MTCFRYVSFVLFVPKSISHAGLKQNCWAFCSILQEALNWRSDAFIQYGALVCNNMYKVARQQVRCRVQELYLVVDPITVGTVSLGSSNLADGIVLAPGYA